MPSRFAHHRPLDDDTKREVWDHGIIVPDSSTLLNLYRLPMPLRVQFLAVLHNDEIAGRLWIPHQFAEEFFRNRSAVISEQLTSLTKAQAAVSGSLDELCKHIDNTIRAHHPLFDREGWKEAFRATHRQLVDQLNARPEEEPLLYDRDDTLTRLVSLLDGHIGPAFSDDEQSQAGIEADRRIQNKIPPSYCDADKDEPRGDYFGWRQMLNEAIRVENHIVFVTEDNKEDWWLIERGRRLGPRPELRKEFFEATQHHCDFTSSGRFLEWARERLPEIPEIVDEAGLEVLFVTGFLSDPLRPATAQAGHEPRVVDAEREEPIGEENLVSGMIAWFHENYEDPANGVPYDGREGGYQYVFGGPYDPNEVLQGEFPDVPYETAERAVQIICDYGGEWVKKGDY